MIDNSTADPAVWEVHPWSLVGSVSPVVAGIVGVGEVIFGLSGLVHPWDDTSRSVFLFFVAIGILSISMYVRRIYFTARRVSRSTTGAFTFTSRQRSLSVGPGELMMIRSAWPWDWSSQYPCRLTAVGGSILVSQRLRGDSNLAEALIAANPSAELDDVFVRGVGGGPFFSS